MRRVLVVEDEPDIRGVVAEALTDEGYEVACAADGASALELIDQAPPDLAVVDLMMPGMDGHHFLRVCRADPRCAGLPVVIITAAGPPPVEDLAPQAVLAKPFDLDELVDTVVRLAPA